MNRIRGINRYERTVGRRSPGWFGKVHRKGRRFVRFFSDSLYGGELGARACAIKWRTEVLGRLRRGEDVPPSNYYQTTRPHPGRTLTPSER